MKSKWAWAPLIGLLAATMSGAAAPTAGAVSAMTQCAPGAGYPAATSPVAFWSTEARCAIVPAGPGGTFGSENFGNKFPGEAAVFMGIVHVAIYDSAVAIDGGYRPYAPTLAAPPGTSPEAAIATAAYDTLIGLQSTNRLRLSSTGRAILDADYNGYINAISNDNAKQDGITVGRQAAQAVLALRANDGLDKDPILTGLNPPAAGPGVWQPAPGRCSVFACPQSARSRSRAPHSSAPTGPTR